MSEDFRYIKLPYDLLSADITLSQFKLIAFLIAHQLPDKESGVLACYFGYDEIGRQLGTSKAAIMRNIKELTEKGVVINNKLAHKLKSGHYSNGLRVDFSAIGGLPKIGVKGNQNDSANGNQDDSFYAVNGNQGDSDRNQGDSDRNQGDSSHIDNRFKNIYLKNNIGKGNQGDSSNSFLNNATGDVAPVRTMPEPDKSGRDWQKYCEAAQLDICDLELVNQLSVFLKNNNYINLIRLNDGKYKVSAATSICYQMLKKIYPEMKAAAAEIGRDLLLSDKVCGYLNGIDYENLLKGEK